MVVVNIRYNITSRVMTVTSITAGGETVGTTGDNLETTLRFSFEGPSEQIEGYEKMVEFGVDVAGDDGETIRPFLPLDENDSVVVPESILSAVHCGKLPIQLFCSKYESYGVKKRFYSFNILTLNVNKALDVGNNPTERRPLFKDVIYDVTYDPVTATFKFRQVDGTEIVVAISETVLSYHYTVDSYEDLSTLEHAKSGDTAELLTTGAWYKYIASPTGTAGWKPFPGNLLIQDTEPTDQEFAENCSRGDHWYSMPSVASLGDTDNYFVTEAQLDSAKEELRTEIGTFEGEFKVGDTYKWVIQDSALKTEVTGLINSGDALIQGNLETLETVTIPSKVDEALNTAMDYTDQQIQAKIGGIYTIKGSATVEELESLRLSGTVRIGDVYNASNSGELTVVDHHGSEVVKQYINAGQNVVWVDFNGVTGWDTLYGDHDQYETKAEHSQDMVEHLAYIQSLQTEVARLGTTETEQGQAIASNLSQILGLRSDVDILIESRKLRNKPIEGATIWIEDTGITLD